MPIDKKAEKQWDRSQNAYDHYIRFIAGKSDRYTLTFADLVFVKNFKGGSAIIAESVTGLAAKLGYYEKASRLYAADPAFCCTLSTILDQDYVRVRDLMVSFADLPNKPASDINGFGCSFASALLHFYFPDVVPILDRRALNGSGIDLKSLPVDNFNNVQNLLAHYPDLIDAFRSQLQSQSGLALRQLDRNFFVRQLQMPPFFRKKAELRQSLEF